MPEPAISDRRLWVESSRRYYLATVSRVTFDIIADNARNVAAGHLVQEDFGVTVAEIKQAEKDRKRISADYKASKDRGHSFLYAEIEAIVNFRIGLESQLGIQRGGPTP